MRYVRLLPLLALLAMPLRASAQLLPQLPPVVPTTVPQVVNDVVASVNTHAVEPQVPEQAANVITVPDLTGMNAAEAAAALNTVGLRYGGEVAVTTSEIQISGRVASQSLAPSSEAELGAAVEILVPRAPNTRLIFDNNDLTLVYFGLQPINLSLVEFLANGETRAQFLGERWGGRLKGGECAQVWAIRRTAPKPVHGCRAIERWITTTDTSQHAWTETTGAESFVVLQDGVERATCSAAPRGTRDVPFTCEFYLAEDDGGSIWPFLYLAYTRDTLVARNASKDGWMRLNAPITTSDGIQLRLNDPTLYIAVDEVVMSETNDGTLSVKQLAPNQCVRFRTMTASARSYPEPCLLFGEALVDSAPFWTSEFTVRNAENLVHTCPPASNNTVTICTIPR